MYGPRSLSKRYLSMARTELKAVGERVCLTNKLKSMCKNTLAGPPDMKFWEARTFSLTMCQLMSAVSDSLLLEGVWIALKLCWNGSSTLMSRSAGCYFKFRFFLTLSGAGLRRVAFTSSNSEETRSGRSKLSKPTYSNKNISATRVSWNRFEFASKLCFAT